VSRAFRVIGLVALVLLVRATSPPSAVAAGVAWARPVPGAVARAFAYDPSDPFVRGRHRGVDLAAAPGGSVRAACGGRVVTARAGQVVTLRCGPWRVTHLPLADVTVHAGQRVDAGARLGTLGTSAEHRGLHLGVRAAGDRFAYVDPLAFIPRTRGPHRAPPLPAVRRRLPSAPVPAPARPRVPRPAVRRLPEPSPLKAPRTRSPAARRLPATSHRVVAPHVRGVRVPSGRAVAPWPAWAGLALVLCGALGGGVRWRVRARRVRAPARAGEGVA
jgi:peptidase M23-like protein